MSARFAGPNSSLRRRERERLFFIAAAGLAFSLLIITLVVLNYKQDAKASYDTPAQAANAKPATIGMVTLLAPERSVTAGTKLSDVKFKEVYWPISQIPDGAVRELGEVKDMYALETLRATQPIQRSQLTRDAVNPSLPVTPGNRAVTIEVDAISGIEGHIAAGSRVDVSLTFIENGDYSSKLIVQNARVLSYGGDSTHSTKAGSILGGPKQISRSATLDVSVGDALKIQTARKLGTLSLMMRNEGDVDTSEVTEVQANAVSDDNKTERKHTAAGTCGRAKIEGKEYIMNCDGTMSQLVNSNEP